jgi:hypothetical protein
VGEPGITMGIGTWKPWENYGKWWKTMGKPWKNDGKWWKMMEHDGKNMETMENDGKTTENDWKLKEYPMIYEIWSAWTLMFIRFPQCLKMTKPYQWIGWNNEGTTMVNLLSLGENILTNSRFFFADSVLNHFWLLLDCWKMCGWPVGIHEGLIGFVVFLFDFPILPNMVAIFSVPSKFGKSLDFVFYMTYTYSLRHYRLWGFTGPCGKVTRLSVTFWSMRQDGCRGWVFVYHFGFHSMPPIYDMYIILHIRYMMMG